MDIRGRLVTRQHERSLDAGQDGRPTLRQTSSEGTVESDSDLAGCNPAAYPEGCSRATLARRCRRRSAATESCFLERRSDQLRGERICPTRPSQTESSSRCLVGGKARTHANYYRRWPRRDPVIPALARDAFGGVARIQMVAGYLARSSSSLWAGSGTAILPFRISWRATSDPYMASSPLWSACTTAPSKLTPAKAPLLRE